MERTQIYLTKAQRDGLRALTKRHGKKQSELIREAIDRMLSSAEPQGQLEAFEAAFGLWKDRTDLPDFDELRASWDRF